MKPMKLPKKGIWQKLSFEAGKPVRTRVEMNLSRLENLTKDGEIVLFPGKILGTGSFSRKITIAAKGYTKGTRERMEKAGCKCVSFEEIAKAHPKGTDIVFLK